jgi:hypothetical protein
MIPLNLTDLSFILAMLIGVVCFMLVKRTTDEFDQWLVAKPLRRVMIPAGVISLIAVVGVLALIG